MTDEISPSQFLQSEGVEDWRIVSDGATARYLTGSFAAGARLVEAISRTPGIEDNPPDVDVRPDAVTVRLLTITEKMSGLTTRDLEVARKVSGIARRLGLSPDPAGIQSLLIVPGAADVTEVMPFWQAVLGYQRRADSPDEDLVDPHDRGTAFWFEKMQEMRAEGGGAIHIAVWVPYEQAEARVAAALAAGGRMVRDDFAPRWWTLADPAGNECDVATVKGRG
jgi:4a-hydroxytetrahydrobiopterin dehydratase